MTVRFPAVLVDSCYRYERKQRQWRSEVIRLTAARQFHAVGRVFQLRRLAQRRDELFSSFKLYCLALRALQKVNDIVLLAAYTAVDCLHPPGGIAIRRVCWLVGSLVCSLVCSFVSSHPATGCNQRRSQKFVSEGTKPGDWGQKSPSGVQGQNPGGVWGQSPQKLKT